MINENEFEAARPYVEGGEQLAEELQRHANIKPRFHRKLAYAKGVKARLLIAEGRLEESQRALHQALAAQMRAAPLSSNVESESWEYLEYIRFAISVAAFRDDATLVEELRAEFESFSHQAIDRYPGVVAIYEVRSLILEELVTYYSLTEQTSQEILTLAAWQSTLDEWRKHAAQNRDYWRASLAYACCLQGEAFDAELLRCTLEQCTALYPDNFPIGELGRAYFLLGDYERARMTLDVSYDRSLYAMVDDAYRDAIDRLDSDASSKGPSVPPPTRQDHLKLFGLSRSYARTRQAQRQLKDFEGIDFSASIVGRSN